MAAKKKRKKRRVPETNYFKEALEAITGKKLPMRVPRFRATRMSDENQLKLQEWCVSNASPPWATGLSIIEAAELMVVGAVENGNIENGDLSKVRPLDFSEGGVLAEIEAKDNRRITSLRTTEKSLLAARDALVPFAKMATGKDEWDEITGCAQFPTVKQVREAKAALEMIDGLGWERC